MLKVSDSLTANRSIATVKMDILIQAKPYAKNVRPNASPAYTYLILA
jgi:hypothetical protein